MVEDLVWTVPDYGYRISVSQLFTNSYTEDQYYIVRREGSPTYSVMCQSNKEGFSYEDDSNDLEEILDLLTQRLLSP